MKYIPNAVATTDLDVAKAAYFGGEFMLYMSFTPAILLGQVDLTGPGAGTWTPSPGATMRAAGGDLQIVPITPVQSAVAAFDVWKKAAAINRMRTSTVENIKTPLGGGEKKRK